MKRDLESLVRFVEKHPSIAVLSGAGISTASGIPAYRDEHGRWRTERTPPVQHKDFLARLAVRQRYWARSLVGWAMFQQARPNAAHRAVTLLEDRGRVDLVITQNVDRLHQEAGSKSVIDLHGRADRVVCLDCGALTSRGAWQVQLEKRNPAFTQLLAEVQPDADANLGDIEYARFRVPDCTKCGGIVKPEVIFFGDIVPKERVEAAMIRVLAANALLVCGSSLMVYSGYRFCRAAAEAGLPIVAVNLGSTRADGLLSLKLEGPCETVLPALTRALSF